jgi:hypothetical protein
VEQMARQTGNTIKDDTYIRALKEALIKVLSIISILERI